MGKKLSFVSRMSNDTPLCSRLLLRIFHRDAPLALLGLSALIFSTATRAVSGTVTMTNPADGATVTGMVNVTCTDSNPSASFGFYVDDVWKVASSGTFAWNTTTVPNGGHGLLCNAYVNGAGDGGAAESVTVANGVSGGGGGGGSSGGDINVNCNGTTDSAALKTAFSTASRVLSHGPCGIDQPLTIDADSVGYQGDGSPWIAPGSAVTFVTGPNSYNTPPWNNLVLRGPRNGSATVGLQVNGNFATFVGLDVQGFGIQVQIGPNGFLDTFISPRLASNGGDTGFYCPTSSNAGEGIMFHGGEMFNLAQGIVNEGCGLQVHGTHIDTIAAAPVVLNPGSNGAYIDFISAYIELNTTPTTGAIFTVSGPALTWTAGQIQEDNNASPTLIQINNGAGTVSYATFDRARFVRVSTSVSALVALCGDVSFGGGTATNVTNVGFCP